MKITLENGVVLDDEGDMVDTLRRRIESKGLKNLRIFLATHKTHQEYLLVEGTEPIFATQQADAMWSQIDIIALVDEFNKIEVKHG